MNKSALLGTVFGATLATAAAGFAGYSLMGDTDGTGRAGSATQARAVAENCYETQVERQAQPKDKHRVAGTVIGAIVGGAVGKDVGDRDVTTAAGAAAGALAGNQIQKKMQENRTEEVTTTNCEPAQ